jgi:uncharacterized membrane protein
MANWVGVSKRKRFLDRMTNWITVTLVGLFIAAMAWGWVLNVKAVWNASVIDGETMVRIVAIFLWPIGCIIGWF